MTEFSITDFNETIIKTIISLFLSSSKIGRREVLFYTLWFIGQYCNCNERATRGEDNTLAVHLLNEERWYHCRYTLFPLYDAAFAAKVHLPKGFLLFQTITGAKVNLPKGSFTFAIITAQIAASRHFLNAQQATKAAIFDISVG